MANLDDIIVAVSSPSVTAGQTARSIVRLSGAGVWDALTAVVAAQTPPQANAVLPCRARLGRQLDITGRLYCFFSPHSYTGQDMAELHLWAAPDVVALLLERLCEGRNPHGHPVRLAEPGEFTLRAYLNGKMDLTQAEAVAQIVTSANRGQLAAAEKLLHGRFSETISRVRTEILEVLGLIEAGLDFTEEDIEFITPEQAAKRITAQRNLLCNLLEDSVQLERMIDLDAVGLAGLPNAGKSSLLNALLQRPRSIVSPIEATTRDILTGVLDLEGVSCVVFDCAGLLPDAEKRGGIDALAHQAAIDALRRAAVVLFCMDASKPSFEQDRQILSAIQTPCRIPIATKADLADPTALQRLITHCRQIFDTPPIITSARTGQGFSELKSRIKNALITGPTGDGQAERLSLNQRHRQRLQEAVKALADAADEMGAGREDTAAMLLRQSYQTLGGLERENVSEKILESIFSRFCIGK